MHPSLYARRARTFFVPLALVAFSPALALAQTTGDGTSGTTVAAPDFSAITSYIQSAIPVGVAALGVALVAALAFAIVFKIGKKIISAA